ncbi:MAG TPA: DUF2723 domain-containing protein [Gemmatimonadales bacterium]
MTDGVTERPPYRLAAVFAAAVLALYVITLAPTTSFWDASEYIAAAHALGIPHPPGNPLFILLAHTWGLIPLAADYGARINLLAAVTSAAAAGLWLLITERWLRAVVPARVPRLIAALAGALVGATAYTVWNQSVANEKVYTISLFSIALVLWLAIRWADQLAGARRDHALVLIAYLLVLTSANHQMGLLVAPAAFVLIVMTDRRALFQPKLLGIAAGAAVIALSVYLFMPVRAALHPYLNEGEPTTWRAFTDVLNRTQYAKPSVWDNPMYPAGPENPGHTLVLYGQQLLNYLQYFTWQFGRDWPGNARRGLAVIFGALGLLGAVRHWRVDRRAAASMTTLIATVTVVLVFYLNFKWGFSQGYNNPPLAHEVRERDYFFLVSFSAWGVWVGMGLAVLMDWSQELLAARAPGESRRWLLATPVCLLALIPLAGNRLTASRAHETMARDAARDVLQSLDPYSIIISGGDNDTFPLWFGQEVDGVRKDVTVFVTSLGSTGWYVNQMQHRVEPPFDAAHAPAYLRDRTWPRPTTPWMSRLYLGAPADTLPDYLVIEQPVQGSVGQLTVQIDPRRLPYPGLLLRSELAVLQIIKEQLGHRGIYFTNADYPTRLGLGPYLVREGLVYRLANAPVKPGNGISAVEGIGMVDVPRTEALAFGVYAGGATAARKRPRGWTDVPSQNALLPYALVYDTIASTLEKSDPATAARAAGLRDAIIANIPNLVHGSAGE